MSLVARALEAAGISTVVIGSAIDIIEHCGVPRFVFTDFPLGNPCGRPFEQKSQELIFKLAVELLKTAETSESMVKSELMWSKDPDWKSNFMHVGDENRAQLKKEGEERRFQQKRVKA